MATATNAIIQPWIVFLTFFTPQSYTNLDDIGTEGERTVPPIFWRKILFFLCHWPDFWWMSAKPANFSGTHQHHLTCMGGLPTLPQWQMLEERMFWAVGFEHARSLLPSAHSEHTHPWLNMQVYGGGRLNELLADRYATCMAILTMEARIEGESKANPKLQGRMSKPLVTQITF